MSKLVNILEKFHSAVLSGNAKEALPDIKNNPRITAADQVQIYIDGYLIRLSSVLKSDHKALLYYLGEEEFDRLAHSFIENNPSLDFNLDRYPHSFAAFMEKNHSDLFAQDLSRLESAISQVFMAEESEALDPAILTQNPERFGELKLEPRRASQLLEFSYPVNSYLEDFKQEKNPDKPQQEASYIYVLRHKNVIERHQLSRAGFLLLTKIFESLHFGEALNSLIAENPELEKEITGSLREYFSFWLENGFFKNLPA